ncbi:FBD-associated F-box protein At5g18780-like isoform X2 [Syzygium oleosum]|uniref:FBD-associated F-box protein At5g18780-like isoform X2 n=1 Tax=Syzygium oleosum TaxID=219896 RepID=UPI0024B95E0D|nr:FBD-associated F-box protein At5g18780-like isoform X2 [Syzygium oleosum]
MDSPSPKRLRSDSEAESADKDRISCLPEEVIGRILSRLTFREAQAICVLSGRWRHLCTSLVTDLDLDRLDLSEKMEDKPELAEKERARYVEWVDNVVHRQSGGDHALRRFALRFDLNMSYKSRIDRWIRFALAKQVKVLELDFRPVSTEDLLGGCLPYLLGHETLMDADVRCPHLGPSISWHVGFTYLEELYLKRVIVDGEFIEQLLANCPVLERLTLNDARTLNRLRVSGQSLKLKYMRIACCDDLEHVRIYDTNLVSFTFVGRQCLLRLNKLPQLSEVSMDGCLLKLVHEWLPKLSSLPFLQILKLEFIYSRRYHQRIPHQLPKLTSVKQLQLRVKGTGDLSLLPLTVVIEACPYLRSFVFELTDPWWIPNGEGRELERVVRPLHRYLKEVAFYNYYGRPCDLELVTYLIASAIALEKLVVNTCDKEYVSGEWKKLKEPRERALQQLKGKVPLKIDLVIN